MGPTRLEGVPGSHRNGAAPCTPAGLYVHVPFCATRCRYCAFATQTCPDGMAAWADAVAAEAARRARAFPAFDTLYLGGGTPGLLPPDLLGRLLDRLRSALPLGGLRESTIEANPGDVTPARAAAWRGMGLDRASLGVQSLDDGDLRFLSRRHDARQAVRAFQDLRRAGFDNLSVDLIYGLPGQSPASWRRTLDAVLSLGPDHVSCYALTVEPATPLARDLSAGRVVLPGDEVLEARYLEMSDRLQAAGFVHYEVSNLARGEGRVARHNGKYWQRVPVLGLGPAAHSFDGLRRWWNVRNLATYLRRAEAGRAPTAGTDRLTPGKARLERLALGFRTREGVPLSDLEAGDGDPFRPAPAGGATPASLRESTGHCRSFLREQVRGGWLVLRDGRACPTPRGMFVADALARRFA